MKFFWSAETRDVVAVGSPASGVNIFTVIQGNSQYFREIFIDCGARQLALVC